MAQLEILVLVGACFGPHTLTVFP